MNTPMYFNNRYPHPSAEVLRKLELSQQQAQQTATRFMLCPVCGFKVSKIPVTQTDVVYVRCRKCKFEGVLSPAYFRRKKRYSSWSRVPSIKRNLR